MVAQEILVQRQGSTKCNFPGKLGEALIALIQKLGWGRQEERQCKEEVSII